MQAGAAEPPLDPFEGCLTTSDTKNGTVTLFGKPDDS
jgi:hypothetical protein